jgi:hypothetical protein
VVVAVEVKDLLLLLLEKTGELFTQVVAAVLVLILALVAVETLAVEVVEALMVVAAGVQLIQVVGEVVNTGPTEPTVEMEVLV